MIRTARMTADDVAPVVAIELAAFPSSASPELPAPEQRWTDELARGWTRAWVARGDDASIVGFIVTWHVVDELHVLNVATLASARRRGVARALVQEALAYARSNAIRALFLEVRRSNAPALALYRAFGFVELGVRLRYYPDGEDAIEMMLQVTGDG